MNVTYKIRRGPPTQQHPVPLVMNSLSLSTCKSSQAHQSFTWGQKNTADHILEILLVGRLNIFRQWVHQSPQHVKTPRCSEVPYVTQDQTLVGSSSSYLEGWPKTTSKLIKILIDGGASKGMNSIITSPPRVSIPVIHPLIHRYVLKDQCL